MLKCKCCNSSNLETINKLIVDGVPFNKISLELSRRFNETISSASLNRHATEHIIGYSRPFRNNAVDISEIETETSNIRIEAEKILADLKIDGLSYGEQILTLIELITVEIATSCYSELKLHNDGKCKFPKDKFTALKDSILMQSRIDARPDKVFCNSDYLNFELERINKMNES